jgi:hypothetical protein
MASEITRLSPVRPITDQIPAGPGGSLYSAWKLGSYTGGMRGILVQSVLGSDGSAPQQVWIGFNNQPPALFNVRYAFRAPADFKSVQIYNNTAVAWTISAILFSGVYIPTLQTISVSGIINPAISSTATLATIPTAGLPTGSIQIYVDSVSKLLVGWQLRADAAGTPQAGKVVPNDWNAITNPRSWYEAL